MMPNARYLCPLLIYCCAIAVIGGASFYTASYAYEAIAKQVIAAAAVESRAPTMLNERFTSAREVKKALATPLALPPPLLPVTVKPAHAAGSRAAQNPATIATTTK